MNKTFKLSQAIITKDGGNIILTFPKNPTNVTFVEHAIRVTDPEIFGMDPIDITLSEVCISTRWEGFYHSQTPEGDVFTFTEDQFKDFIKNEVLNKVEDKYPEYQGFIYHSAYKVEIDNIDYMHIKRVA